MRFPALENKLGLFLGVTTRPLGNMRSGRAFARAFRRAGLDPARWAGGRQVHGKRVRWVDHPSGRAEGSPGTDGVATGVPGLALRVFAADCVPVFIIDENRRALALVHAGWRGTKEEILPNAVRLLKKRGVPGRDLWVVLGPHIRPCCYEVGESVARRLPGDSPRRRGAPGKYSLDLGGALARQARAAGIPRGRFVPSPYCTACDRRFFSFRRDKTGGRQAAVAALLRRPGPGK